MAWYSLSTPKPATQCNSAFSYRRARRMALMTAVGHSTFRVILPGVALLGIFKGASLLRGKISRFAHEPLGISEGRTAMNRIWMRVFLFGTLLVVLAPFAAQAAESLP